MFREKNIKKKKEVLLLKNVKNYVGGFAIFIHLTIIPLYILQISQVVNLLHVSVEVRL